MLAHVTPTYCRFNVAAGGRQNKQGTMAKSEPELSIKCANARQKNAKDIAYFKGNQARMYKSFLAEYTQFETPDHIFTLAANPAKTAYAERSTKENNPNTKFTGTEFSAVGLLERAWSFAEISQKLDAWIVANRSLNTQNDILVVDMSWGLLSNSALANFGQWIRIARAISRKHNISIASLYNRSVLIDEHFLAALHGHPTILTSRGFVTNPHWLPWQLFQQGTSRQKTDFLLRRVISEPDSLTTDTVPYAAEGAAPKWLENRAPSQTQVGTEGWKISCLGRLRLRDTDSTEVNWAPSGGATRKTKALFAYLLQKGQQGAQSDELADFLWPDCADAATGRARLHNAVRSLRQVLAQVSKNAPSGEFIKRDGSRYIFEPPDNCWLDISAFEQLCRRVQIHLKAGATDEALTCARAADNLYAGDLFADIDAEYTDIPDVDWCWSKRYWLREMFFKLQYEAARLYRKRQQYSEAMFHCQRSFDIDPTCETAHQEMMYIFHAQGRHDAINRQYKLYLGALQKFDNRPPSTAIDETLKELT